MRRSAILLAFICAASCCALVLPAVGDEQPSPPKLPPLKGVPDWLADYQFRRKKFTFVRVQYSSFSDRGKWGKWRTDYPDADLNLSARLKQLTSLEVDEKGKVLKLTDPRLAEYPFIYLCEPGHMMLGEDEVNSLRKYLLGGGFLMVDDLWGENEWHQLLIQIKRVFPQRKVRELPLEHKIFHCVFDLKEKPQVPSIAHVLAGVEFERSDAGEVHYRGIFDNDRLMVVICHNTDLADGWERSDVDPFYYREYCEKKAFPMGINIVFYALTQ